MQAPEICPITVATAAPATPMSRPKMNTGSRTMFNTAPEPWTIIKPAGCPVVWSSRSVKNCMHMPMDAPQQMVRYSNPRPGHHRVVGGQPEKQGGSKQGKGQKQQPAQGIEQKSVAGHPVGLLPLPLPQALGEGGVEAHSNAGTEGHHHQLHRVGIAEGQEVQVAHLGHIDAVHQVIDGAHQHGDHDGGGHGEHQPVHRHGPQDVSLVPCAAHGAPLPSNVLTYRRSVHAITKAGITIPPFSPCIIADRAVFRKSRTAGQTGVERPLRKRAAPGDVPEAAQFVFRTGQFQ